MELEIMTAMLQAETQQIKEQRDLELEARDVLSNHLAGQLDRLFPGAPPTFIQANGDFANELARGAGELADAIADAGINWTGPAQDTGVDTIFTEELVRLMAVDSLVSGKVGLFPRLDDQGNFSVEVMSGYLHPIFKPGNALKVEELLQVIFDPISRKYEVRRYAPGIVEQYPPVDDWLKFSDNAPEQTWTQPHATDRLPVAFAVTRRDAHRQPYGLVCECLSAFRRYARTAVNRNAVQEIAGFPEVVVKSDTYLQLLLGQIRRAGVGEGMEDPAITAIKQRGARKVKFLGKDDVYEIMAAVDPAPHIEAETNDKQALLDLLRSPDMSGGNQTEVALAERAAKSRALIKGTCKQFAVLVTDALALSAGISGSGVPKGITASLTPSFPADTFKRTDQIANLYSKGLFTRSEALTELQSLGWGSVTDEAIDAARAEEAVGSTAVTDDEDDDATAGSNDGTGTGPSDAAQDDQTQDGMTA